jgi:hypothetical protein
MPLYKWRIHGCFIHGILRKPSGNQGLFRKLFFQAGVKSQDRMAFDFRVTGKQAVYKINNLALKGEVCCFGKVYVSGYIPFITP